MLLDYHNRVVVTAGGGPGKRGDGLQVGVRDQGDGIPAAATDCRGAPGPRRVRARNYSQKDTFTNNSARLYTISGGLPTPAGGLYIHGRGACINLKCCIAFMHRATATTYRVAVP